MKTADLYDLHGTTLQVMEPGLASFGKKQRFSGAISTFAVFEDNSLVRTALEEPGQGRVLVVDGAGSRRYALLGDRLAALAVNHGWAGILLHGCLRDRAEIAEMDLGVLALGSIPRKTEKRNSGERDRPVHFLGVTFHPGHHLYADEDGVVVADKPL